MLHAAEADKATQDKQGAQLRFANSAKLILIVEALSLSTLHLLSIYFHLSREFIDLQNK